MNRPPVRLSCCPCFMSALRCAGGRFRCGTRIPQRNAHMRIVLFYHSVMSDWNFPIAHFLRGVASELVELGHEVVIFEPVNSWSVLNLITDHGIDAIRDFRRVYPQLRSIRYDPHTVDLASAVKDADLVMVHESTPPELVAMLGALRTCSEFQLLYHDTHHRCVTNPAGVKSVDLHHYDGVLVPGQVMRAVYLGNGWTNRAWVWHGAADPRVFKPHADIEPEVDVVWIGNWGDE